VLDCLDRQIQAYEKEKEGYEKEFQVLKAVKDSSPLLDFLPDSAYSHRVRGRKTEETN